MNVKTFRAKSLQQALDQVRQELGPEASVLHTRELNAGLVGRLFRGRQYEVAASVDVGVASRFPATAPPAPRPASTTAFTGEYREKYREDIRLQFSSQVDELHELVSRRHEPSEGLFAKGSESLFAAYTDMIESDLDESTCRSILEEIQQESNDSPPDANATIRRAAEILERQIATTGGIQTTPGAPRVVALVGPTGVGKTTTIAKLAANFRLRERLRVGLITVDTYRVAAVEQLRTYADIIDLPMEVVATPREMREAVGHLADLDLVLLDTAGRSPRDEVRIQELKSVLSEAQPDEVHLVLSSTASGKSLLSTTDRFAQVGVTSLLLTKLDEATTLGHLASLARSSQTPISYLTNGQNVPDDIRIAEAGSLALQMMGVEAG